MLEESESNTNCADAKVVLVGESGVGKTSIIKQFTIHTFDPDCAASISSQFTSKIINISDLNKAIRYDLWDTAGQEKYRSLAKIFYKDAKIVIFVYDITNKKSFEILKSYWHKEVSTNCLSNTIFAVVGNKSDLYNISDVEEKEAINWADSIGAIFQTTSAKTNIGIDLLFDILGKKVLNPKYNYKNEEDIKRKNYEKKKENNNKDKDDEEEINSNFQDPKNIKIDNKEHKGNKIRCCM